MNTIHVLPLNDLYPHYSDGSPCLCQPVAKAVIGGTLVVHNSWDGREFWEEAASD